ncbi:MAG TPA: TRIC cation channel family protein [Acidimicrobiales bacterium]|nr:TRIC cation channel family protein [Acidimicrobiales bacterium]
MVQGFDPTLIIWLNLVGTFVFGLSGGLAAVRARLDIFGVLVLAVVVALAGGITRDLLIGTPPATFRDWRYLAAAGAAGLATFAARSALERLWNVIQVLDAAGLALFCVTGAAKAVEFRLGPAPSIILGAITGIGGGMLRDVLIRQIPTVLRHDLYAVPALAGAAVVVGADAAGIHNPAFPLIGFAVCFVMRIVGLRFNIQLPIAPSETDAGPADDDHGASGPERDSDTRPR